MARSDYGPEVQSAMKEPPRKGLPGKRPKPDSPAKAKAEGDTPAELARDKQRGIVEGSARDEQMDAAAHPIPQQHSPPQPQGGVAPQGGNMGHSPAHAMMAASIAHAILGGGRGGGY